MEQNASGLSRRTVVKGAAWSVPVIAAAIAAPLAAASVGGVLNSEANYYWAAESQGEYTTLSAAAGGLMATFSTQIAYRANPWANPPAGASLVVVVTFDSPVRLDPGSSLGGWTPSPALGATTTTFTFTVTPSSFGGALTFNVVGSAPGPLASTAAMSLISGGTASWAAESSGKSAILNA